MLLFIVAMVATLAYARANRDNRLIRQALSGETHERERAEASSELALEALDRIYEQFAPNRFSQGSSLTVKLDDGEDFSVSGTVTSGSGKDLAGVKLKIHYTDDPADNAFVDFIVEIQAGNVYSFSGFAVATVGQWNDPPYLVTVTFVDQATYGTASATAKGTCGNGNIPT